MTTKVTINATCAPEQYVLIVITKKVPEHLKGSVPSQEIIHLSNGETHSGFINKDIACICVSEQDNVWTGYKSTGG